MNKKVLYGFLFGLCVVVSILLYVYQLYYYLIASATAAVILFIVFIISKDTSDLSNMESYNYELNRLLKTYRSILVKTDNFPKLKSKSILKTQTFDDLLDAQADTRNPIYYISKNDSSVFYILNGEIFLMYVIKNTGDEYSSLELEIKKSELEEYYDLDKIDNFDKTIILNTNNKSIKISPIRDK